MKVSVLVLAGAAALHHTDASLSGKPSFRLQVRHHGRPVDGHNFATAASGSTADKTWFDRLYQLGGQQKKKKTAKKKKEKRMDSEFAMLFDYSATNHSSNRTDQTKPGVRTTSPPAWEQDNSLWSTTQPPSPSGEDEHISLFDGSFKRSRAPTPAPTPRTRAPTPAPTSPPTPDAFDSKWDIMPYSARAAVFNKSAPTPSPPTPNPTASPTQRPTKYVQATMAPHRQQFLGPDHQPALMAKRAAQTPILVAPRGRPPSDVPFPKQERQVLATTPSWRYKPAMDTTMIRSSKLFERYMQMLPRNRPPLYYCAAQFVPGACVYTLHLQPVTDVFAQRD